MSPVIFTRLARSKHNQVHKSFRSDNILFFPPSTSALNDSATLNLDCPWILGFESSRPEDDFTDGRADSSPSRNIYRHPDRQMSPQKPFSKIHDIYALGVVLLEIGKISFLEQTIALLRLPRLTPLRCLASGDYSAEGRL